MNEENYNLVEEVVEKQLNSQEYSVAYSSTEQGKTDRNHFYMVVKVVTGFWGKNEKGNAPEALKIAALCHDLDRIYPHLEVDTKNCSKKDYPLRKMIHSGNSALIFSLENNDLSTDLIYDASYLIMRHEVGGDRDKSGNSFKKMDKFTKSYDLNNAADYLFWADKFCFFKTSIFEYCKRGEDRLKFKINFTLEGLPQWLIHQISDIDFDDELINRCVAESVRKFIE